MKSDLERLLEASLTISRMKREAELAAEAIASLTADNRLLRARLRLADLKLERGTKWPIDDLHA
jgi:hypothetical protein